MEQLFGVDTSLPAIPLPGQSGASDASEPTAQPEAGLREAARKAWTEAREAYRTFDGDKRHTTPLAFLGLNDDCEGESECAIADFLDAALRIQIGFDCSEIGNTYRVLLIAADAAEEGE